MVRQQVWPLPHLHPLNPLVLQRKRKRKWAPQREPQARDMVPTMERKHIQTAMLTMERRAPKAMAPNLITEIHVNGTGGQGANGLCHCPPCASQGSLHHQTMSRLACFLLLLLFCSVMLFILFGNRNCIKSTHPEVPQSCRTQNSNEAVTPRFECSLLAQNCPRGRCLYELLLEDALILVILFLGSS